MNDRMNDKMMILDMSGWGEGRMSRNTDKKTSGLEHERSLHTAGIMGL